jgi:hypothetical protein
MLNQQTSHGPVAHVVFVCGIQFVPDGFGNNTEHRSSVKFEIPCIDGKKLHDDVNEIVIKMKL